TLLTFGLFLFVINALMLWLAAALVPGIAIGGFGAALLGRILLTLLNVVIEARLPDRDSPARGIPEAGAATRSAGRQSASPFPGAVRVSARGCAAPRAGCAPCPPAWSCPRSAGTRRSRARTGAPLRRPAARGNRARSGRAVATGLRCTRRRRRCPCGPRPR